MYRGCDHFVEGTVDQDEVNHARMTHRETEDWESRKTTHTHTHTQVLARHSEYIVVDI